MLITEQPRAHLRAWTAPAASIVAAITQVKQSQPTEHSTTTHCILYSAVLHTLPLVSGIHCFIQSPMIWTSLHQFLNPDLKHSCTQRPISNHSVTLIAPAICLIGRHTACFFLNLCTHLLPYLFYMYEIYLIHTNTNKWSGLEVTGNGRYSIDHIWLSLCVTRCG